MKLHKGKRMLLLPLLLALVLASAALLTGCGGGKPNQVRVFCYGDYMDPVVVDMFEEETGLDVILDTFDTVEEMYPVIKNRAGVYDVLCPSDYMIERMVGEGLLQEIDTASMENYKNIDPAYLKIADASYDPGNKYSVPYQIGIMGIMYNKKKLGEGAITSWADMWNKDYKGKMLMQDSLRDTMGASLKSLGYSLNSIKETELDEASKHLIAQKPLVYKYANDSARDLLIGNSADLGVVWNGELLYSQELNPDLDFCIPKEGTEIFQDCWVIPSNAFHKENAEKWIDFMCRPDIAFINYEYLTYSTPNKAAREMMEPEDRNNPYLFPDEEVLSRCESLRDVGPEGDDLFSKYWKIFKSE